MYQLLHFHPNGRWPRLQPAVVVGWSLYHHHRHVTRSNDYFDANYIIASQPIQLVLSVYSPPTVQMSDISDANAENRNSYLIFGISHSLNRLSRWGGTQLLSSPRNPGGEEEARRLKWCYWGQSTNETLCPFPFTFRWPNYRHCSVLIGGFQVHTRNAALPVNCFYCGHLWLGGWAVRFRWWTRTWWRLRWPRLSWARGRHWPSRQSGRRRRRGNLKCLPWRISIKPPIWSTWILLSTAAKYT